MSEAQHLLQQMVTWNTKWRAQEKLFSELKKHTKDAFLSAGPVFCMEKMNIFEVKRGDVSRIWLLYMAILGNLKRKVKLEWQQFVPVIENLINTVSSRGVRICAETFAYIVKTYSEIMDLPPRTKEAPSENFQVLGILRKACRLQSLPGVLNPIHHLFMQHCIRTKSYQLGLNFLMENRIYAVNPSETGSLDMELEYLTYWYYGGVIALGMKNFQEAKHCFWQCLVIPAEAVSRFALEAYKKFILLSLICDGCAAKIPEFAPHPIRSLERHSKVKEYHELQSAFLEGGLGELKNVHQKYMNTEFALSKNNGLIKQCIKAFARHRISALTNTYITRSLADIAKVVGLPDASAAELIICEMIETDAIDATIDDTTGMVTFTSSQVLFDSEDSAHHLNTEIKKIFSFAERIGRMDENVSMSSDYIKSLMEKEER